MSRPKKSDAPAKTRLYIVLDKKTGSPVALVESSSIAQTRNHIAEESFTIRYAEQADILLAAKAGLEPVSATAAEGDAREENAS